MTQTNSISLATFGYHSDGSHISYNCPVEGIINVISVEGTVKI